MKKKRRKNYLGIVITVFVLSVALVIIAVMGVSSLLTMLAKSPFVTQPPETEQKEPVITQPPETQPPEPEETQPPETEPVQPETEPPRSYTTISLEKASSLTGSLVLVNAEHEYTFPSQSIINIYGNKTRSYSLSNSSMQLDEAAITGLNAMMDAFKEATGLSDVMVRTAYRDYDAQMAIYSDYVNKNGLTGASQYVSMGGYSDHNTGYGFDISVYSPAKGSQTLDSDDAYSWIYDNCHKHGFVRRFPEDKLSITGIKGETYHFRYVGVPHAYYMAKHNLCLEEYIEELKKYPADGEHLVFNDDFGSKWEVFYAPVAGEITEVKLPDDTVYRISGTNEGGFVIALLLADA